MEAVSVTKPHLVSTCVWRELRREHTVVLSSMWSFRKIQVAETRGEIPEKFSGR